MDGATRRQRPISLSAGAVPRSGDGPPRSRSPPTSGGDSGSPTGGARAPSRQPPETRREIDDDRSLTQGFQLATVRTRLGGGDDEQPSLSPGELDISHRSMYKHEPVNN